MSEDALWRKAREELAPWGVLHRVENSIDRGTGDVAYAIRVRGDVGSGWIELKHVPKWPANDDTPFVIRKLTQDQVDFLVQWQHAGGRAWCLLQVGRGYWLLDPPLIQAVHARTVTGPAVRRLAVAGSPSRFPFGNILRALVRPE